LKIPEYLKETSEQRLTRTLKENLLSISQEESRRLVTIVFFRVKTTERILKVRKYSRRKVLKIDNISSFKS
jgi:hypothetical protein